MNSLYSLEYYFAGEYFSVQIYGTLLEAQTHADNLGTFEPELVNENIQLDFEPRLSRLN